MSAIARVGSRLALIGLGVSLALVVLEGGLRLMDCRREVGDLRGLHEARPDRGWLYGLRPGAHGRLADSDVEYVVNVDGFRDRRYQRPKPAGTFRIVVLGDSISFGYGVRESESFPKLIEARLHELVPTMPVEVLNLGVNGYNPYNEAALFSDVGVTYEPDLVLVQFCINDLNDPTLHFDRQTRLHLGAIPDAAFPNPAERRVRPSALSGLLAACYQLRVCALLDAALLELGPLQSTDADRLAAVVPADSAADRPEWAWLRRRYGEIAQQSAAIGARFAVLAFPYPAQLGGEGPHPIEERLVEVGREAGWRTLDLLPAFRRAGKSSPEPLFLDWWHPTVRGHRVAADAIVADLQCHGLLPVPAVAPCVGEGTAPTR